MYDQVLADVRSTGAGSKCLYCIYILFKAFNCYSLCLLPLGMDGKYPKSGRPNCHSLHLRASEKEGAGADRLSNQERPAAEGNDAVPVQS